MATIELLRNKKRELAEPLALLNEKIAALRNSLAVEAATAVKIQLKYELAEAERERDKLDKELEEIEKEIEGKSWITTPRPLPADAPLPGASVILTCDRSKQDERFHDFFSQLSRDRHGAPQAYFILGEWEQRPGSLVVRFKDTWIREHVNKRLDAGKTRIVLRRLDWPDQDDLKARQKRLSFRLLHSLIDTDAADTSAASCRLALAEKYSDSVLVIEHNVVRENWDRSTGKLLNWYLNYWDEVKREADIPLCVLFFNVVYPTMRAPNALVRGVRGAFRKLSKAVFVYRLQRRFHQPGRVVKPRPTGDTCSSVVLQELECVKLDDVLGWFQRINLGDSARLAQWCAAIFGTADPHQAPCQNMLHVENKLSELRDEIEAMYVAARRAN